jgi:hypothetical protein
MNQNNNLTKRKVNKFGKSKRRGLANATPNSLKTRPQKMGVGRNCIRIEIPYEFENTQPGSTQNAVVQVGPAISTTVEWDNCSKNFKYFKIKVVNIILPPRPAPTDKTFLNGRIYMDWSDSSIENVTTNDNAKEVPFFSTRTKVYKFIPPNSMLHSYSTNITYNYSDWMPVGLMNANSPGWLKISCEYTFSFRMEIICEFRSNETQVSSNAKHVLKGINNSNIANKIEEEEEEKEEEEKKEEIKEEVNDPQDNKGIILKIKEQLNKIDL